MNDPALNDLITLYRRAAHERPPPAADQKILANAKKDRRRFVPTPRQLASAAALLLLAASLSIHMHASRRSALPTDSSVLMNDTTSVYLIHMPVQPSSPLARHLMFDTYSPH